MKTKSEEYKKGFEKGLRLLDELNYPFEIKEGEEWESFLEKSTPFLHQSKNEKFNRGQKSGLKQWWAENVEIPEFVFVPQCQFGEPIFSEGWLPQASLPGVYPFQIPNDYAYLPLHLAEEYAFFQGWSLQRGYSVELN